MSKNKGEKEKDLKQVENKAEEDKQELICKTDGQEYASVVGMLSIDGIKWLCYIPARCAKGLCVFKLTAVPKEVELYEGIDGEDAGTADECIELEDEYIDRI
ncbi:hypothetical protein F3Y22_tig00110570pilonHSYRG00213 [Hibiscus syriacus]|uniref:Uncharacterized protein n=1 Tax=Hibiscus syriacus TaxID=106335 RepID=A0A6A3A6J1_HIBSY|nr:hypothetical protein F3Y22_tig00110570pilonHSYRG00213 [Hibiscus syriacus]